MYILNTQMTIVLMYNHTCMFMNERFEIANFDIIHYVWKKLYPILQRLQPSHDNTQIVIGSRRK